MRASTETSIQNNTPAIETTMNINNTIFLCGNLTKDVEVQVTRNNVKVAKFTLAVKRGFVDKTDFIVCTVWKQTAEYLGKYSQKGDLIQVAGELNINVSNDKYYTEVNCSQATIRYSKKVSKQRGTEEIKPEEMEKEQTTTQAEEYDNASDINSDSDDAPF